MRPLLTAVATVLAVAFGAIGGPDNANSAGRGLTWKVEPKPFRLTVFDHEKVLVRQELGRPGAGTRLSFRRQDDGQWGTVTNLLSAATTSTGSVYTVATTELARTATVTVSRSKLGLVVSLDLGSTGAPIRTVYEAFAAGANEHYLGAGEQRDDVDLNGTIVPLKVWDTCGRGKPAPFYLSSKGYGVHFRTTAVGRIGFGRVQDANGCQLGTSPCEIAAARSVVQTCFKTNRLSYEIFPGSPSGVVRAYMATVGRAPLPDPSAFALTKWRDRLTSAAELDEDVDRFEAAGIPLGWVIVDNPWEKGLCAGSLEFDPGLFPDPRGTIDRLNKRGVKVMMWISPTVRPPCGLDIYPSSRILGTETFQAIDLTDTLVAATFEARLRNLLDMGVDGFKADRGDEVDLEQRQLAGGSGADLHNQYPVLFAESVMRASRTVSKSTPTMFRSGSVGSQRLITGSWAGDLRGTWDGLENAIRSAQTAGLVGYSTWGSDVGGYVSQNLTADVFVRWTQLGAISPIFEVGGDGLNATPWVLGDKAMRGLRKAAILHYELFPYLYQLSRGASATGVPVLRPLALQYPTDERAWDAEYELLVGSDLLAAPVTVPGVHAAVYLPEGNWIDVHTGARLHGPRSFSRRTPLDELPLFLREGAAIPFNLREPAIWREAWDLNDQFRPGRGGWLVAPGSPAVSGTSVEYGSIKGSITPSTTKLQLKRARRETQVVVVDRRIPVRITIDGKPIARSSSASALRRATAGWFVRPAPTRGIVLKLAPRGGRSTVSLEY